jgi:PAT family acetyl-CoA transporter-like MFS transporter 1
MDVPLVSLGGYLKFWAGVFVAFTVWLILGKKEDATSENDPDMDVKKVYKVMWSIVRLKSEYFKRTLSWTKVLTEHEP